MPGRSKGPWVVFGRGVGTGVFVAPNGNAHPITSAASRRTSGARCITNSQGGRVDVGNKCVRGHRLMLVTRLALADDRKMVADRT
jgi:hypothetical protein